MKVMEMEIIKKKLPWLVKVAFKYFVRWLVKELLRNYRKGCALKSPSTERTTTLSSNLRTTGT